MNFQQFRLRRVGLIVDAYMYMRAMAAMAARSLKKLCATETSANKLQNVRA